jgi:hypothetical protein
VQFDKNLRPFDFEEKIIPDCLKIHEESLKKFHQIKSGTLNPFAVVGPSTCCVNSGTTKKGLGEL